MLAFETRPVDIRRTTRSWNRHAAPGATLCLLRIPTFFNPGILRRCSRRDSPPLANTHLASGLIVHGQHARNPSIFPSDSRFGGLPCSRIYLHYCLCMEDALLKISPATLRGWLVLGVLIDLSLSIGLYLLYSAFSGIPRPSAIGGWSPGIVCAVRRRSINGSGDP